MQQIDAGCRPEQEASPKARQILEAARDLFLKHGYAAASTDMIQRAAGVSKSTLYAYYPTKDALFAAVVASEGQIFARTFAEIAFEGRAPAENLRRLGESYLALVLAPPALGLYRTVVGEAATFPDLAQAFHAAGPELAKARLARYLARATDTGQLGVTDPEAAAGLFLAMLRGDLQLRAVLGVGPPPDGVVIGRTVAVVVDCFLAAYGPRASIPAAVAAQDPPLAAAP